MVLSHSIPSAVFDSVDQSIDQSINQSLTQSTDQSINRPINQSPNQSIIMVSSKIFAQLLFSSVALAGSLDLRQAGTKVSKQKKKEKKNTNIYPYPPKPQQKKKTPQLTSFSLSFFPTKQQCDSDDACKTPCRTPNIQAQGVNVTPSEKIQDEARRRFGDAHCENKRCACAVSWRRRKKRRRKEGEQQMGRYDDECD